MDIAPTYPIEITRVGSPTYDSWVVRHQVYVSKSLSGTLRQSTLAGCENSTELFIDDHPSRWNAPKIVGAEAIFVAEETRNFRNRHVSEKSDTDHGSVLRRKNRTKVNLGVWLQVLTTTLLFIGKIFVGKSAGDYWFSLFEMMVSCKCVPQTSPMTIEISYLWFLNKPPSFVTCSVEKIDEREVENRRTPTFFFFCWVER